MFLFVILITTTLLVIYYTYNNYKNNSWSVSSYNNNLVSYSSLVNPISIASYGSYIYITDSILATEVNYYNSKYTVVYSSSDNGNTFGVDLFPEINNLTIGSVSSDGTTLVGISHDTSNGITGIYSSQDSSTTWQPIMYDGSKSTLVMNTPYSISMDSNGTYLCVCGNNTDGIWYSSDTGDTWTQSTSAPIGIWSSVCMSKEISTTTGYPLVTIAYFCGITSTDLSNASVYLSYDAGATWMVSPSFASTLYANTLATTTNNTNCSLYNIQPSLSVSTLNRAPIVMGFVSPCMSYSGTYHYVIITTFVYASMNRGATWIQLSIPEDITDWISISCDETGKKVILCSEQSGIFTSFDYGSTWVADTVLLKTYTDYMDSELWVGVHCIQDGTIAVTYSTIYLTYKTKPTLLLLSILLLLCSIGVLVYYFYSPKTIVTGSTNTITGSTNTMNGSTNTIIDNTMTDSTITRDSNTNINTKAVI